MLQNKILRDHINLQQGGLRYALEQLAKEYRCNKCNAHYNTTVEALKCCELNK